MMVLFFELYYEKKDVVPSEMKEHVEYSIPEDIQAAEYDDDVSSITLTGIDEG